MQLELFEMVDGGYLGLAAAYSAVTIAAGYAFVRLGIAFERRHGASVGIYTDKAPRSEGR
jgi:fluoride ion exporter CrcB/FEX